jgi:hypothetical protein
MGGFEQRVFEATQILLLRRTGDYKQCVVWELEGRHASFTGSCGSLGQAVTCKWSPDKCLFLLLMEMASGSCAVYSVGFHCKADFASVSLAVSLGPRGQGSLKKNKSGGLWRTGIWSRAYRGAGSRRESRLAGIAHFFASVIPNPQCLCLRYLTAPCSHPSPGSHSYASCHCR